MPSPSKHSLITRVSACCHGPEYWKKVFSQYLTNIFNSCDASSGIIYSVGLSSNVINEISSSILRFCQALDTPMAIILLSANTVGRISRRNNNFVSGTRFVH